jgi:hypothetical protein
MISPAVMFIESAADSLKRKDPKQQWLFDSQQKELTSFGDERAKELHATGISDDFRKGYELGLQTARVILAGSVALGLKGVKPDDVL